MRHSSLLLLATILTTLGCARRAIPTTDVADSLARATAAHRTEYKQAHLDSEHGPLRTQAQVDRLRFYPADAAYRVQARFIPSPTDGALLTLALSSGTTRQYRAYGTLDFEVAGRSAQLIVYQSPNPQQSPPQYRDYLFLPFNDLTNGDGTYGGGRYLDLRTGDIEGGKVILDFNKAYNPYCAYADGYACPIPPAPNRLDIAILAGEKDYDVH